ncbi:MAG: PH domain-containing protein [Bacteroidia bacterium]|nr:PH domain-containing protein [Bacteroidia bacterium]
MKNKSKEDLLVCYRISPVLIYINGIIFLVLGIYLSSFVIFFNFVLAFILAMVVLLTTAFKVIEQLVKKYSFYQTFMITESGIMNRSINITEYFRFIDVKKSVPFYFRPLNLAIYHIYTNDINEPKIIMKGVKNDDEFLIMKLREFINISRVKNRMIETI